MARAPGCGGGGPLDEVDRGSGREEAVVPGVTGCKLRSCLVFSWLHFLIPVDNWIKLWIRGKALLRDVSWGMGQATHASSLSPGYWFEWM